MIEIDGSDGGGQVLRTACALATLTGENTRIGQVRGNRPDPGLKAQHLTAIETLATLSGGSLENARRGAEEITVRPAPASEASAEATVEPTDVEATVGTAGSITLVFDTVLPLAVACDTPVGVTITGGTEVKWSPPLSAHQQVKLPLCRRFGLQAAIEREQTGFYPAGGGRATLWLAPSTLSPVDLTDRGSLVGARIYSRASGDMVENAASRQAARVESRLADAGVPVLERQATVAETASPGSAVTVELVFEQTRAAFDALGDPERSPEAVGDEAVEATLDFRETDAAVDRHVADQLLVFLALAGGEIRVPAMTDHVETSLELLEAFGVDATTQKAGHSSLISINRSEI